MVFLRPMLSAAKRIPLIKFRKGGPFLESASAGQHAAASTGASGGSQAKSAPSREAIEEWQLPARYRRKPIDDVEIEYINRGGPA